MGHFKSFIERDETTTKLGGLEDLVTPVTNINHVLKGVLDAVAKIDPFLSQRTQKAFSGTIDYISPEAIKYGTVDSDIVTDICAALSRIYPELSQKISPLPKFFQEFENKFINLAKMVQGVSGTYYRENIELSNKLLLLRLKELQKDVEQLSGAVNVLRTKIDIKSIYLIGCQKDIVSLLGSFDKFYSYFQKSIPDVVSMIEKTYNSTSA